MSPARRQKPASAFPLGGLKTDLRDIPGIGQTFVRDFARIGITRVAQLEGKSPDKLFAQLVAVNAEVGHATSKNYLSVIRMAVYFSEGGRDPLKLKWSAWSDRARQGR